MVGGDKSENEIDQETISNIQMRSSDEGPRDQRFRENIRTVDLILVINSSIIANMAKEKEIRR